MAATEIAASTEIDEAAEFARRRRSFWLVTAGAIALSSALHFVPQLLRDRVDPAWSMLILLVVDAAFVAFLVRSRKALLIGLGLVALLGCTVLLNQQVLAALPSIALNTALAGVFGASLRQGATPLIVHMAELDNPAELTPEFVSYLRRLTSAWMIFFGAMAGVSLVLILLAPFEWWSLVINVMTWPLLGAMFAVEWVVRRVGFPQLPAHTPWHIVTVVVAYQRRVGSLIAARSG